MNILFITSGVSRITIPLFERYQNQINCVIQSKPRKKLTILKKAVKYFAFMYFRYLKKNEKSLSSLCKKHKIDFYNYEEDLIKSIINTNKIDLIVVYSMSHLLNEDIYKLPKYGTINLHTSYLPKYRGPFPEFWQYYFKDLEVGATVHYIDKGEDTGDIICQSKSTINLGTTSKELFDLIEGNLGVKLLVNAIELIRNNSSKRIKQPKTSPTKRARNLNSHEHSEIIDWENWEIERVWHFLRGTYTWLDCLPAPPFPYIYQRWIIGDFLKYDNHVTNPTIVKKEGKHALLLNGGEIELKLKFSIITFFKNIIISGGK